MRERSMNTICPAGESLTIEQQNEKQLVLQQLVVENAQLTEEVYSLCTTFIRFIFRLFNICEYVKYTSLSNLKIMVLLIFLYLMQLERKVQLVVGFLGGSGM